MRNNSNGYHMMLFSRCVQCCFVWLALNISNKSYNELFCKYRFSRTLPFMKNTVLIFTCRMWERYSERGEQTCCTTSHAIQSHPKCKNWKSYLATIHTKRLLSPKRVYALFFKSVFLFCLALKLFIKNVYVDLKNDI